MRDEQAVPDERPIASRSPAKNVAGVKPDSSPPPDLRADIPERLASDAHPADVEEAGLTDEEIAIYRRRVAEGFYSSREIAAEVARRMLRSRDI